MMKSSAAWWTRLLARPREIRRFAFGMGVERIAMLKHRIGDIRHLNKRHAVLISFRVGAYLPRRQATWRSPTKASYATSVRQAVLHFSCAHFLLFNDGSREPLRPQLLGMG
jgi:hypothetical protein